MKTSHEVRGMHNHYQKNIPLYHVILSFVLLPFCTIEYYLIAV